MNGQHGSVSSAEDGVGNRNVLLSAREITVNFGGLRALDQVNIEVPEKSTVGLVGPNGAGKSVLFGVLSGFIRPSTGHVVFNGRDVTKLTPQFRARLGLVRSFQMPELFSSLTVAEHVLLGHRMAEHHWRIWRDLARVSVWQGANALERENVWRILRLLGIESYAFRDPTTLPAGVSRLVEVGRVLSTRPRLLMLDEPAAGLDDAETEELRQALSQASASGETSILIVEHDFEFVLKLSNHVYVLDAGKLIAFGGPEEIRRDEAVQRAYLGSAR